MAQKAGLSSAGHSDFLEQMALARRTTYEFGRKKVSKASLKRILESARWAPSFVNNQPWSFIVVEDEATILRLKDLCFYGNRHNNPPIFIVVVSEPFALDTSNHDIDSLLSKYKHFSLAMPVLNMVYEAQSMGISSCILSPKAYETGKILKIPNDREAVLILGLGYEKADAFHNKRERKDLLSLVHYGTYGARKP